MVCRIPFGLPVEPDVYADLSTTLPQETVNGTHVEDEEAVFSREKGGWAKVWHFCALFVPPLVPTLGPWDLATSPLQNQDVFDVGTAL